MKWQDGQDFWQEICWCYKKVALILLIGSGLMLTVNEALAYKLELNNHPISPGTSEVSTAQLMATVSKKDVKGNKLQAITYYQGLFEAYPVRVNLEGGYGGLAEDFYMTANIWTPIMRAGDSVLFLDYKIETLSDWTILQQEIGLVYRWLLNDQQNIFGAYGYFNMQNINVLLPNYDRLQDDIYVKNKDDEVNSMILGLEFMSKNYELRLNYYHTLNEKDEGYFQSGGYYVVADSSNMIYNSGGCSSVVCRLIYNGLDFEAGYTGWRHADFYLSYYIFGSEFLRTKAKEMEFVILEANNIRRSFKIPETFSGFKARVEIPIIERKRFKLQINLQAGHDNLRNTNYYAGIRMQFLFGGSNLVNALVSTKGVLNEKVMGTSNYDLSSRVDYGIRKKMFKPTVHDNQIIRVVNIQKENFSSPLYKSDGTPVNLYFVGQHSSMAGSGNAGTWNNPMTTLEEALATAQNGDIIYVFGERNSAGGGVINLNNTLDINKSIRLQGIGEPFKINGLEVNFGDSIDLATNPNKYVSSLLFNHNSGTGLKISASNIGIYGLSMTRQAVADNVDAQPFIATSNPNGLVIQNNTFTWASTRAPTATGKRSIIDVQYTDPSKSNYSIILKNNHYDQGNVEVNFTTIIPQSANFYFFMQDNSANSKLNIVGQDKNTTGVFLDAKDTFRVEGFKDLLIENMLFDYAKPTDGTLNPTLGFGAVGTAELRNNKFQNLKLFFKNTSLTAVDNDFSMFTDSEQNRDFIQFYFDNPHNNSVDLGKNNNFTMTNSAAITNQSTLDYIDNLKLISIVVANNNNIATQLDVNIGNNNNFILNNLAVVDAPISLINVTINKNVNTVNIINGDGDIFKVNNIGSGSFSATSIVSAIKLNVGASQLETLGLQGLNMVMGTSSSQDTIQGDIDYAILATADENVYKNVDLRDDFSNRSLIFVDNVRDLDISSLSFRGANKTVIGANNLTNFKISDSTVQNELNDSTLNNQLFSLMNLTFATGSNASVELIKNNNFSFINNGVELKDGMHLLHLNANKLATLTMNLHSSNVFSSTTGPSTKELVLFYVDAFRNSGTPDIAIKADKTGVLNTYTFLKDPTSTTVTVDYAAIFRIYHSVNGLNTLEIPTTTLDINSIFGNIVPDNIVYASHDSDNSVAKHGAKIYIRNVNNVTLDGIKWKIDSSSSSIQSAIMVRDVNTITFSDFQFTFDNSVSSTDIENFFVFDNVNALKFKNSSIKATEVSATNPIIQTLRFSKLSQGITFEDTTIENLFVELLDVASTKFTGSTFLVENYQSTWHELLSIKFSKDYIPVNNTLTFDLGANNQFILNNHMDFAKSNNNVENLSLISLSSEVFAETINFHFGNGNRYRLDSNTGQIDAKYTVNLINLDMLVSNGSAQASLVLDNKKTTILDQENYKGLNIYEFSNKDGNMAILTNAIKIYGHLKPGDTTSNKNFKSITIDGLNADNLQQILDPVTGKFVSTIGDFMGGRLLYVNNDDDILKAGDNFTAVTELDKLSSLVFIKNVDNISFNNLNVNYYAYPSVNKSRKLINIINTNNVSFGTNNKLKSTILKDIAAPNNIVSMIDILYNNNISNTTFNMGSNNTLEFISGYDNNNYVVRLNLPSTTLKDFTFRIGEGNSYTLSAGSAANSLKNVLFYTNISSSSLQNLNIISDGTANIYNINANGTTSKGSSVAQFYTGTSRIQNINLTKLKYNTINSDPNKRFNNFITINNGGIDSFVNHKSDIYIQRGGTVNLSNLDILGYQQNLLYIYDPSNLIIDTAMLITRYRAPTNFSNGQIGSILNTPVGDGQATIDMSSVYAYIDLPTDDFEDGVYPSNNWKNTPAFKALRRNSSGYSSNYFLYRWRIYDDRGGITGSVNATFGLREIQTDNKAPKVVPMPTLISNNDGTKDVSLKNTLGISDLTNNYYKGSGGDYNMPFGYSYYKWRFF